MAKSFPNIVILTGAGISAESGIETFRASDGLWHNHHVEDIATPEGFERNPELVQEFYNARRKQLQNDDIQPNEAHKALADLEEAHPDKVLVITQNVDDLHERGGTQNLIHMHGELNKVHCQNTGEVYEWFEDVNIDTVCDCCNEPGNLRPHIVWFGEMPLQMDEIYQSLEICDLFISIGTSGKVYPAAGFVQMANQAGAKTVELNLDPTDTSPDFDLSINGKAGDIVPKFVAQLLEG